MPGLSLAVLVGQTTMIQGDLGFYEPLSGREARGGGAAVGDWCGMALQREKLEARWTLVLWWCSGAVSVAVVLWC